MATRNDTFKNVQIGEVFFAGGNTCRKMSTKTAEILEYSVKFYFRQNDPVTVG